MIKTIVLQNNAIKIIDQTKLPERLVYKKITTINQMVSSIKKLEVRGAPAIGIAAAFSLALWTKLYQGHEKQFKSKFFKNADILKASRPTAVNLAWAVDRILNIYTQNESSSFPVVKKRIVKEAIAIYEEDLEMSKKIGEYGNTLIKKNDVILTHCNAGGLATSGLGTALAVIYEAHKTGKKIKVYADETRPLLQGARLTTWELQKEKIDVSLITDNMAAVTIKHKKINKIIVGADRIAANGDTANKIGTYNLGILAKFYNIPLYIAAPSSTFDFSLKSGDEIPIEERQKNELIYCGSKQIAPTNMKVYNPAFDVTPHNLIAGFITEKGIIQKPYFRQLSKIIKS